MLPLGHMGITLGTAVLLDGALSKSCPLSVQSAQPTQQSKPSVLSQIDLRLLLVGSLLPDIIDKPLGQVFFRDTFSNGRIFCHTLLFPLLIALAGFYLYRRYRKTWPLVLSFGTFVHLILDQMWLEHRALLWPLYGFAFEKIDLTGYEEGILHGLRNSPAVYVPETIGAVILVWLFVKVVHRRKVCAFARKGRF